MDDGKTRKSTMESTKVAELHSRMIAGESVADLAREVGLTGRKLKSAFARLEAEATVTEWGGQANLNEMQAELSLAGAEGMENAEQPTVVCFSIAEVNAEQGREMEAAIGPIPEPTPGGISPTSPEADLPNAEPIVAAQIAEKPKKEALLAMSDEALVAAAQPEFAWLKAVVGENTVWVSTRQRAGMRFIRGGNSVPSDLARQLTKKGWAARDAEGKLTLTELGSQVLATLQQ